MTSHRPFRYAGVALVATVAAALAVWALSGSVAAVAQQFGSEGTKAQPSETPGIETPPKSDDPKREKRVKDFERRLGRFKPLGKIRKKDPNDQYLLATADVTAATKHADVRFMVVEGQRKTAEFLVDYIVGTPEKTLRKWHVFARFKEAADAEQALATARMQYDRMVAYREQLQRIYAVQSSRRC